MLLLLLLLLLQCVAGYHQGGADLSGAGAAAGPCRVRRQPPGILLLHTTSAAQLQDGVSALVHMK
jgi:hypothetical protein